MTTPFLTRAALALAFATSPWAQAATTLQELYQKAEQTSERVQSAQLSIERQDYASQELKSKDAARINLKAETDATRSRLGEAEWKSRAEPSLGVELRYPLYDGGANSAVLAGSEALKAAASHDTSQEKLNLKLAVTRAFYEVLAAEADLKNLEASRSIYQKRIATLEERQRIGRSRTSEVQAASTQLQLLLAQIQQARTTKDLASYRLAWYTGLKQPFDLRDELAMDRLQEAPKPLSAATSPAAAAAAARAKAAEQQIEKIRANTRPRIDAIAAYTYTRPNELNSQKLSAGLGLTWTLYEAGETHAAIAGAGLDKEKALLSEREQLHQSELDLRTVQENWRQGLDQLKSLEQAYTSSSKALRTQQQDFDNGLITNLEIMQALDTQLQVKRTLDQTVFRLKQAYTETQLRSS